jgi:RimJ/RimL family protein N-acetyltransferase
MKGENMMPLISRYGGPSNVSFFSDQDGLRVAIDTERLHIESVRSTEAEYDRYAALFGDVEVMKTFATGVTKTREEIAQRIETVWAKRWRESDPYSAFSVTKNDTDEFVGSVVLGHSQPGVAEIAYVFARDHWRKGYGSEGVASVVKEYAPATRKERYLLDGEPLREIVATARTDNVASLRILEKAGFVRTGERERYGALRTEFSLVVSDQ